MAKTSIDAVALLTMLLYQNPTATTHDLVRIAYEELDPFNEAPFEVRSLARTQLFYLAQRITTSRFRISDSVVEKASSLITKTGKPIPGGNGNGVKR